MAENQEDKTVLLQFTGPFGAYTAGDVAGFPPRQAASILKTTRNARPYIEGEPVAVADEDEEDEPPPAAAEASKQGTRGQRSGTRGTRRKETPDPAAV